MTLPLLIVDAPAVTPYQYGLAAVAQPVTETDEHWRMGVQYEQIGTYAAQVLAGPCGSRSAQTLPAGAGYVKGFPFAILAGVDCTAVGYDEAYILARAKAILQLGWQHAAESALWTGAGVSGAAPLNASTTPSAGTGLSFTAAVGALEKYLSDHYTGVGVIHATRDMAAYARKHRQVVERAGKLQTALGTQWCFGGGYDGTGPNATAPAASHAYLYATGPLTIRRDDPTIPGPGLAAFLARDTNAADVWAEQLAVLTVDGPIVAVNVDLTLT